MTAVSLSLLPDTAQVMPDGSLAIGGCKDRSAILHPHVNSLRVRPHCGDDGGFGDRIFHGIIDNLREGNRHEPAIR